MYLLDRLLKKKKRGQREHTVGMEELGEGDKRHENTLHEVFK